MDRIFRSKKAYLIVSYALKMAYAWSIVYFCTCIPFLTGLYACMFRSIYISTGTFLDWQKFFRHKCLVVVKPAKPPFSNIYCEVPYIGNKSLSTPL